jgi:hypothetical protein
MNSRSGWTVAGILALVLLIFGFSTLFAQRGSGPEFRPPPGGVGRYQVVRSNADVTILLDTVTGDLYNAAPSDIKPFGTRWRPPDLPLVTDKDKAVRPVETKDLAKDALKDRIKDELEIRKDKVKETTKELIKDEPAIRKDKVGDKDKQ